MWRRTPLRAQMASADEMRHCAWLVGMGLVRPPRWCSHVPRGQCGATALSLGDSRFIPCVLAAKNGSRCVVSVWPDGIRCAEAQETNPTGLSRRWQPASPRASVLTVFVVVGKTGSTTVHQTIMNAVASSNSSYCVIDVRRHDTRPCFGNAIVFGADFGSCTELGSRRKHLLSFLPPGSRCQYLTTLREPGNRTVSEYNYFCRGCAEGGVLCNSVTGCPHTSFMQWARDHAEQFTQHFSPPLWPPTTRWVQTEGEERDQAGSLRSRYWYQYSHGFPDRPRVNDTDYERALGVLSGHGPTPMLTIKLEQLEVDGWERIEEFIGAPGLDLRSHEKLVLRLHGRPKKHDYEPTEEEMKDVRRVIDAYDSQLYRAVPTA